MYSAATARDKTCANQWRLHGNVAILNEIRSQGLTAGVLKRHRVLNASVPSYFPRLNRVEVPNDGFCFLEEVGLDSPELGDFRNRWLHFALIVRRAGLEDGFRSIPLPCKPEPGVRLGIDRALHLCDLPDGPAVRGHFDLSDGAA